MSDAKVTPFRFSDEELELLGIIQGHTGIRSRMEALRAVARYHAETEESETPKAEGEIRRSSPSSGETEPPGK